MDTPVGAPPEKIIEVLTRLVAPLGAYDRVAVGFPGVVRKGRVLTAPNLGNDGWKGHDLAGNLGKALGRPVRVANDADLQGMAVIAGNGVEMVVTLGKGLNPDISRYQRQNRQHTLQIAELAVKWDQQNPREYDQRWITLYGKVAATSDGRDDGDLFVPESEWPAILKRVHDTHLESVRKFAEEKRVN